MASFKRRRSAPPARRPSRWRAARWRSHKQLPGAGVLRLMRQTSARPFPSRYRLQVKHEVSAHLSVISQTSNWLFAPSAMTLWLPDGRFHTASSMTASIQRLQRARHRTRDLAEEAEGRGSGPWPEHSARKPAECFEDSIVAGAPAEQLRDSSADHGPRTTLSAAGWN